MTTQEVLDFFGNINKTAKALAMKRQNVGKWGEHPPIFAQWQIELITKGSLKSESYCKSGVKK